MVDYGTKYDRLYETIVTPYKDDGSFALDEGQLRKFLQYFLQPKFLDAGIGIMINPEAGEVFYLSREEKLRNVKIAVEEVKGRVPIFAGVSSPTTADTLLEAKDAIAAGVDGIFAMPAIGALDVTTAWDSSKYPEVWLELVKAIAKAIGDKPIIAHPVGTLSVRYGEGLPVDVTVRTCQEVPNVVGWKMTYNYTGFRIVSRALRRLGRHVAVLGAPAVNFHENLANDCFDGTVSGSWNYAPEPMLEHILAWRRGDWRGALKIWQNGLAELQEYVYSDFARLHIKYKTATWLRGFISNPFMRPPLPKPRKAEVETLRTLLKNCGMGVIEDAAVRKVTDALPL
ncbi:MAG: dihydrodipicolinate synthase family protein [Thermodesulfobacteriota bacterium]